MDVAFLGVSASARLGVQHFRTGGRVVVGAGLENRYARKGIEGSNPSLSVRTTTPEGGGGQRTTANERRKSRRHQLSATRTLSPPSAVRRRPPPSHYSAGAVIANAAL